jgi:hypothetical protein
MPCPRSCFAYPRSMRTPTMQSTASLLWRSQVVCLFVLIFPIATAPAAIVADSNVLFGNGGGFGDYSITVYQNPAGDPTSIWFDASWNASNRTLTLSPQTWNIDEEADYYLASLDAPFSANQIAAGSFTPWFVLDHAYPLTLSNIFAPRSFYFGINTGVGVISPGPNSLPKRDVFGWIKLEFAPATSTLRMLDNAMAYGEPGIVIGRDLAVPEPSAGLLAISAILLAALGRPRRIRQPSGQ